MPVEAIPGPPVLSPRTSSHSTLSRVSRRRRKAKQRKTIKFNAQTFVHARQLGEDVEQFYEIQDKIGEGGFGEVFRALHKKTGAERAVKVIYKTEDEDSDFEKVNTTIRNEFAVVKSLDHVSIINIYSYVLFDVGVD